MKNYIILIGALLFLIVALTLIFLFPFKKKSDSYRVNVELTDVPDNLVHISLMNWETEEIVTKEFTGESSIDISFTGSVPELSFFYLDVDEFILEEKKVIQHLSKKLFIGNEEVTIKGKIDSIEVITNSETQKVLEQWNKESKHINEPLHDLKVKMYEDYKKGDVHTQEFKDNMVVREDLSSQLDQMMVRFIAKHKNSESAAFLLNLNYQQLPLDTVRELYHTLGETIKQSKYNDPIEIYINTEVLDIGDDWNDFTAFNTDGDSLLLSEVKQSANRYMLLVFSRRGCIPCENSISELKDIYT